MLPCGAAAGFRAGGLPNVAMTLSPLDICQGLEERRAEVLLPGRSASVCFCVGTKVGASPHLERLLRPGRTPRPLACLTSSGGAPGMGTLTQAA